ncbi:hypothetical protein GGI25_002305 [Coemansia spiralis]|uniref:Uncharacterized protein n=2 Tax=Coemansia TaxID=4863 RepID=A0A9W8G8Y9_9FUNG|nr:hypothetical protein EDC05_001130 [Coemansia umbellata]KAJ2625693.1 hypothetical protein GGI26_000493 [Coemansia sp. RSA 1358]KAJ2678511.1 hypothetical protein GGI25_002305 [Coemansia spiralis]
MSQAEDFDSLARTLCNNPHRAVLLKNAFQCQQELSKMGIGSPKPLGTDMTLFSAAGICAKDLQPLNDPFIIDNIFKSAKKRRRGLLSWSALPIMESYRSKAPTEKQTQDCMSQLWDFSRHIRARNRRRSILGTKCSLSSMRRRRQRSSAVGEHTRSISDPTSAISGISPRAAVSRVSESTETVDMHESLKENYSSTLSGSATYRSLESFTASESISDTYSYIDELAYKQIHAFPRLAENRSTSSIFNENLLSVSFPSPPAAVHCAEGNVSSASTLRGVPGHPASSSSRSRPSTPYISVSALRLISSGSSSTDCSASSVKQPAPALLRPEMGLRGQRCISMPCAPLPTTDVQKSGSKDVRIVPCYLHQREVPQCLVAVIPFEMASPHTKFSAVKNSLEIKQPAACVKSCQSQCLSPRSIASDEDGGNGWLIPAAVGILRRMAFCGGAGRGR